MKLTIRCLWTVRRGQLRDLKEQKMYMQTRRNRRLMTERQK